MEPQTVIEYELIEPDTNKRHFTRSREEALDRHREKWLVFERQATVHCPSLFTQAHMLVIIQWHINPEYREV